MSKQCKFELLKQFRDERNIDDAGDFYTYLLDELTELSKEIYKGDMGKAVFEACDIGIFVINYIGIKGYITKPFKELDFVSHRQLDKTTVAWIAGEVSLAMSGNNEKEALLSIYHSCMSAVENAGYDFDLAMIEKIKEISSRTGDINPETGKWEKHKVQANIYQANIEACRK